MKKYRLMSIMLFLLLFVAMPVWAKHKTAIHRPLELRKPPSKAPLPPSTPTTPIPENGKWNEPGTVIKQGIRNDIVVAPMFKFSQINDNFGFLAGGRLGWVINHQYLLGLEGYWLVNDVPGPLANSGLKPDLAMKYGGVVLEYIIQPQNTVHFSLSNVVGIGSVTYDYSVMRDDDTYWVVEPALNVYFNITQHLRTGLGFGYRWVSDVDAEALEGPDLSGFAITLSINFGTYGENLIPQ